MSPLGTKRSIADEPSRSALNGKADEIFSGLDHPIVGHERAKESAYERFLGPKSLGGNTV